MTTVTSPEMANTTWTTGSSFQDAPVTYIQVTMFPEGTPIPYTPDMRLKRALMARIEINRDGYVIASGAVDEEGYGPTYEVAYRDFLTSLRDRYYSLRTRGRSLSEEDRTVLQSLRSLLE